MCHLKKRNLKKTKLTNLKIIRGRNSIEQAWP